MKSISANRSPAEKGDFLNTHPTKANPMKTLTRRQQKNRRLNINRRRLQLETLETRALLTAVPVPANLVSWWKAENSGADVMGLNNA